MKRELFIQIVENNFADIKVMESPISVIKNGVTEECVAIKVRDNLSACFYPKGYETEAQAVKEVKDALENHPNISVKEIQDKNYILKNCFLTLSKSEDDNFIFGKVQDMYVTCRVAVPEGDGSPIGTYLIKKEMMRVLGISPAELFIAAQKNLSKEVLIRDMESMVSYLMGKEEEEEEPEETSQSLGPMTVVTNRSKNHGAAYIFSQVFLDMLERVPDCLRGGMILIPSSIHEVIILCGAGLPLNEVTEMVQEVNELEVREEERLADKAYRLTDILSDFMSIVEKYN